MVLVKVKYFSRLRELLHKKEEEYELKDGSRVMDLLIKYVPERHSEASSSWRDDVFRIVKGEIMVDKDGTPILRDYAILVNGEPRRLSYKLKDGDEVAILPPVGGG